MSEHLTRINKLQRVEMIEMGLNPLNPQHVQKYLSGGAVRANVKENEERIKALMGDKLNASLGHGAERDMDVAGGMDPNSVIGAARMPQHSNNPQAMRQQLMEDMDDYAGSVPSATQGLMNLRQPTQQPAQGKINLNEVANVGKKLATNYYNAFIQSLQNPSTQANMQVFKALKAMLEQEQKLRESQALPTYQRAVQQVTAAMYKQLKG
jgi:formiminotetrahydrofolate cyclodeaminase